MPFRRECVPLTAEAATQPRADRGIPLTVIIPVLNEEQNLPDALATIDWAEQVIVVDSHSVDRTAEIARTAGAEIVQFNYVPSGPKKKSWALQHLAVRNDWILLLDADERVTPNLRAEIEQAIRTDRVDGYYLDRELIFMGRRMRCFRPNWNMRLFRAGRGRIEDLELSSVAGTGDNEIHEHVVVNGAVAFLRHPLLHDDYRGLTAWLDRHNKYATWEAHLYRRFRQEPIGSGPVALLRINAFERKRVLRRVWVRLPFRPGLRFIIWYVFRRGYADGRAGLIFCILMSYYEFIIGVKMRELEQRTGKQAPRP
jgi:glycosyltransferase involved in cell wall biosynthesis